MNAIWSIYIVVEFTHELGFLNYSFQIQEKQSRCFPGKQEKLSQMQEIISDPKNE